MIHATTNGLIALGMISFLIGILIGIGIKFLSTANKHHYLDKGFKAGFDAGWKEGEENGIYSVAMVYRWFKRKRRLAEFDEADILGAKQFFKNLLVNKEQEEMN